MALLQPSKLKYLLGLLVLNIRSIVHHRIIRKFDRFVTKEIPKYKKNNLL